MLNLCYTIYIKEGRSWIGPAGAGIFWPAGYKLGAGMIQGIHLTEALLKEKPQFLKNHMNLFESKTGQGKTTAAILTIPKMLELEPTRCLILIDSIIGRDEKVNMGLCQQWGEKELDKPYIMTYSKFGALVKAGNIQPNMFDYIACDEIHNLIKYVRIDEAQICKRNPESAYELICLILSRESLSYIAVDAIMRWMKLGLWTFAFTATPGSLSKWSDLSNYIHNIQVGEQLVAYQVLEKYEYTDIHLLLAENPENKRLIHVPTINQAREFADEIHQNTGRNALPLWSTSNGTKMSEEQLAAINTLTTEHVYPEGVDDIIATEAYATGWNLEDENVDEVIVHSGNKDIQIQFPGRKRGDWKIQWNYNSQKAEREKRAKRLQQQREKVKQEENTQSIVIPSFFLNRKLNKEDKEQLIRILNYPKKWTSLKKAIEKDYNVRQVSSGAYYGHIIEKKT